MKVILYMEVTINGFIARNNNDTEWISNEAWNSYNNKMAEMDAIVIGKNTYDMMPREEFRKSAEHVVVISKNPVEKKVENISFSSESPEKIIEYLQKKDYQNICIAGGGKTNASFMKDGLIDEIYLDIEPVVFGTGISLFAQSDFEYKLELLKTKKLNENTIQLHYIVIK